MEFEGLSDWIAVGHCAALVVAGGDPANEEDVVAFIEKTPRVRRSMYTPAKALENWVYGPKGNDEYGQNARSRDWCELQLRAFGWKPKGESPAPSINMQMAELIVKFVVENIARQSRLLYGDHAGLIMYDPYGLLDVLVNHGQIAPEAIDRWMQEAQDTKSKG